MIVGLAGRIHSGKDSAGAALIYSSLGFKRVAFADCVRRFVAAMLGVSWEWVNSDDFKKHIVLQDVMNEIGVVAKRYTGRELLQRVGTEAARKIFGDDCWIKVAMAKCLTACVTCGQEEKRAIHYGTCLYAECPTGYLPQHYVITDVRFPNEYGAIKAEGGKVIRLNRADRQHIHDYIACPVPGGCSLGDVCHYDLLKEIDAFCKLPRSAHPSHYSGQMHPSETSLPDHSNGMINYDGVLTGDMAHNVQGVMALVAGWL